jgi:Cu+-exporting ATPase
VPSERSKRGDLSTASCQLAIHEILGRLKPPPSSIAASLVDHSVTIEHDKDLPPSSIRNGLLGAGFILENERELKDRKPGIFGRLEASRLKRSHLKHCQLCQAAQGHGKRLSNTKESAISLESGARNSAAVSSTGLQLVKVDIADDSSRHAQRLYISISGMTCASCVGAVTGKIEEVAGVSEVAVDFIGKSAVVVIPRKELAHEITTKVEEAGFEAEILSSESLLPSPDSKSQTLWTAELIVHNMSTSCVEDVRSAVKGLHLVRSIDVVRCQRERESLEIADVAD